MKIVVATDSFKGSLTSSEAIDIISQEAVRCFGEIDIVKVPIADGGEGTVEAIVSGGKGETRTFETIGPIGEKVISNYGVIDYTAIIEMAQSSGLPLVPVDKRNPLETSSYGTGQLIKHALDEGFRKIAIGIGGSATNDGGMGAMQALGVQFYDVNGNIIKEGCGKNLEMVCDISTKLFDSRVKDCDITVLCDVNNPLTGEYGATYVYGPQKGATKEILDQLEKGMINYSKKLNDFFGRDVSNIPGAGAAGGIGCVLNAFCDAKLESGIKTVLQLVSFEDKIKNTDIIITGEGRVDYQSAFGKVIYGVSEYANNHDVPVIVIAGAIGEKIKAVYDLGIKAIVTLPNGPMDLDECMDNARYLLKEAAKNIFNIVKVGKEIN